MTKGNSKLSELPRINHWLVNGFQQHFLPRYLRKHFHVVACNRASLHVAMAEGNTALVVYCNHPSWWDPMLAIYMRSQLMPEHHLYAPIDSKALEQYKIFKSMGFYGVSSSHRGAAEFLKRSLAILQSPGSSIWLTPEGRFTDPRQMDVPLQPGLAHLALAVERTTVSAQLPNVWFVPAAIEYPFWEERLPQFLCWFGEPVQVQWNQAAPHSKDYWQTLFTNHLRHAQKQLAEASIARDTTQFEVLLHGKSGSWSFYDAARKALAKLRGKELNVEHSSMWRGGADRKIEGQES